MNMKDGDKQPLFYNGRMSDDSPHIIIFMNINDVVRSKNIQRVLKKRGLWILGLKRKCNVCM